MLLVIPLRVNNGVTLKGKRIVDMGVALLECHMASSIGS